MTVQNFVHAFCLQAEPPSAHGCQTMMSSLNLDVGHACENKKADAGCVRFSPPRLGQSLLVDPKSYNQRVRQPNAPCTAVNRNFFTKSMLN